MEVLDELERRFAAAIEAERRAAGDEGAAGDAGSGALRPRARRMRALRRPRHGLLRRRRGRRRLPGLPLATGGALATLAVVAALVLALAAGDGGDRVGGDADGWIPPSSPELLERAARNAAQAPPPPVLRDGELWYVRGEGVDQWTGFKPMPGVSDGWEAYGLLRRFSVEQWSGLGGEGRTRELTVSVRPRFARDRPTWEATPPPRRRLPDDSDVVFTHVRGLPLRTQLLAPDELRAVPSEPVALLRALETAVRDRSPELAPGSDALNTATFEAIRELLLLPVSPEQRAGLLRAFGLLPGTRAARIDTDARGRRGVILVYTPRTHPRMPRVLVVDDENGRLLAARGPRNSVETTYVVQGVARDVTALPEGVEPPKARLPRTRHE